MTIRVDSGEASDHKRARVACSDLLPEGPQTMTDGGFRSRSSGKLQPAGHRLAWMLAILLSSIPVSPAAPENIPPGYESFGLAPDDFTTDPITFHPRLLAKISEPWLVTTAPGVSAPRVANGGSDGTHANPRSKPIAGHPNTARWIGILGFVLLLLRRSHRYR
jgi:hypothetical protein